MGPLSTRRLALLVIVEQPLLIATAYSPASAAWVLERESITSVWFGIGVPSCSHWYERWATLWAPTEKETGTPGPAMTLCGGAESVMAGARELFKPGVLQGSEVIFPPSGSRPCETPLVWSPK